MHSYWNNDDATRKAWEKWFEWFKSLSDSLESTFNDGEDTPSIEQAKDIVRKLKESSEKIQGSGPQSSLEEVSDSGAYSDPWERIPWRCRCESRMLEDSWGGWALGTPSTMTFIVNLDDSESKKRYIAEMEDYACGDSASFGMVCHSCGAFLSPEEEIRGLNEVDI